MYWPILVANFWHSRTLIQRSVTFTIRSDRTGTESLLKEIRERVWSVNANLPLAQVRTLQEVYERSLARTSSTLMMLVIAGARALLLGLVVMYGVISHAGTADP